MVMAEPIKPSPLRIGDYDIIRTIGKGNFAVVKLARHQITHTEVAIKIIEKTTLDQSNLKKIYREIQILKLLRHQHIMKLYQVIETKTTIYLVCEYASHGELFDYITQEEKIPEDKARKMFHQVLTAIEYCHKNNVVHRDLKAENLLLDANDNVKLADFGFGNFFQSGQNLNTWCGSPPYAAPEVFEGKLYEGPQLDVWSLGIVLYVLVCGTFPFDGSNLATLKERVLAGRFRIPYWMSQDCENLIRRMLVVNPKKRLTIAQIKKHKWMQVFSVKPEAGFRTSSSPVRRAGNNQLPEFNEHILKYIQGLGIDRQKTIESLRKSAYNQLYAIYHLLVDRLKHHRTSFPTESRLCYDAGKRRPSNIADQTMTKHPITSNPVAIPRETKRPVHRNQFFAHQQHVPAVAPDQTVNPLVPDVNHTEVHHRINMHFPENIHSDIPPIHRTLRLNQMHAQHMSQPPMSPPPVRKSKFVTHPGRGPLPHQSLSFNAGMGVRNVYQRHPNRQVGMQYRGSGDVIPSVTSIDEGVELNSASPSEQEMIKHFASQQRRHTLELPNASSMAPFIQMHRREPFSRSPIASVTSQADSLVGSMSSTIASHEHESGSDSIEMSFDGNPIHNHASDVTPRLVLSPCIDELTEVPPPPPEERITYIDNQRQLLDVSPTGFREGRRASDGLLLLGDGRLGEHLKRLTRTNGFATINQEDVDDSCFDVADQDMDNRFNAKQNNFNVAFKEGNFGTMTSHSSHYVMQVPRNDAINYQPYELTHRRRSLHVGQDAREGRSSSYSKDLVSATLQQQSTLSPLLISHESQSYDIIENNQRKQQWSSWKPVSENEASSVHASSNHRRDPLNRTNFTAFVVASDESMTRTSVSEQTKRKPSLPITPLSHQLIGQQSLGQQLHQRRFNRRLNVAKNMQTVPSTAQYCIPLSELEQLDLNVDFGYARFLSDRYTMSSSNEELSARQLQAGNIQHYGMTDVYRGDSLDLQQTVPGESFDLTQQQPAVVLEQQHPLALCNISNDSFRESNAMEFL